MANKAAGMANKAAGMANKALQQTWPSLPSVGRSQAAERRDVGLPLPADAVVRYPDMAFDEDTSRKLRRVAENIRKGRLVVLVGAGASMGPPANLPSWWTFLERLADHAEQFSKNRAGLMREQMQTDLLAAADIYEVGDGVPPLARHKFLRDLFTTEPGDVTPLSKTIANLDAVAWVTTNYDSILRYALEGTGTEMLGNPDAELSSAVSLLGSTRILVHLHGRAAVPEGMVLSHQSYQRLTNRQPYRTLLRDIFLNYCVLAVGFSFMDPPFQEALRFISEDLQSAGHFTHLTILPEDNSTDTALLTKANFEVVLYDSKNGHGFVDKAVRWLSTTRSGGPGVTSVEREQEDVATRGIVAILASLTNKYRGQTYDMVGAAVVVSELQGRPQRASVLIKRVARSNGIHTDVAKTLVERGIIHLENVGIVEGGDGAAHRLVDSFDVPDRYPNLERALKSSIATIDRRASRDGGVLSGTMDAVRRVMIVQGMTAARAFVNQDAPDAYLLEQIVAKAVEDAKLSAVARQTVKSAIVTVLKSPTEEVSREIFYLANAAFALESVFLNPVDRNLGDALSWQLYLDSNVLLRSLHPACDASGTFDRLLARLRTLQVPLHVLRPFVDEVLSHIRQVERIVRDFGTGEGEEAALYSLLRETPPTEQSPILRYYWWGRQNEKWGNFNEFRAEARLRNHRDMKGHLRRLGVALEGEDAIKQYDTSERETLWAELRKFRSHDQYSAGARKLRRAEATQVLWLAKRREQGLRAWLLSRDGQLRRALKFIDGGQFAGYVMTPTAWMMRLNSLHWGEVDVAGFSELMWAVPLTAPIERLKKIAMAGVLSQEPDLAGEHPEWLRDQIDSEFQGHATLVAADAAQYDDDGPDRVAEWSKQLVPQAVEQILARLAEKREADEKAASRTDKAGSTTEAKGGKKPGVAKKRRRRRSKGGR